MPDITQLILDDHDTLRRSFAALDDATTPEELSRIWDPLATLLDVHAVAEEEVFYPSLLRKADEDGEETEDAIHDHNKIRDAVHEAARHEVASDAWWEAVGQARSENSEHLAEEEDEGLADFRRNASVQLREELGEKWLEFKSKHGDATGIDTSDKDPQEYIEEHRGS